MTLSGEALLQSRTTYRMTIECAFGTIIEIKDFDGEDKRKRYMDFNSPTITWLSIRINGELIRFDEVVNGTCVTDEGIITIDKYEDLAKKILTNAKQKPQSVKKIELGLIKEA